MNKCKLDKEIFWDYPITGLYINKKYGEKENSSYSKKNILNTKKNYNKQFSNDIVFDVTGIYYTIIAICLLFLMLFLSISISKATKIEYTNQLNLPYDTMIKNDIYNTIVSPQDLKNEKKVQLNIPTKKIEFKRYRVKNNENIFEIAKKFGLHYDSIALSNNIKNNIQLKSGIIIVIPNQDGRFITVSNNDSIYRISNKYGVSWKNIVDANNISDKNIKPGLKLFIPGSLMTEYEREKFNFIPKNKKLKPKISIENKNNMIWPVRGTINSYFGMRIDPFKKVYIFHSGIDIKGNINDPVLCPLDGIVSYTGWTNIYGNFILIKHSNELVTLYGHLNSIDTTKGMNVKKGEIIGTVGTTGRSTGAHLHFEVRKRNVPVNPLPLLNTIGVNK